MHVRSPLGRVHAVPIDVERVLQNLLSNALKYRGEEPPEIEVRTEDLGNMLLVCPKPPPQRILRKAP